ncbi:MAG: type IV secretory system conjugative DNA transfer family protein, partial [Luteibacter sp.]
MTSNRGWWAAALAVVALLAGEYFAGLLTLWFLGLGQVPLGFMTFINYVKALDLPQVQPYVWKIKTAGIIGFLIP